MKSSRNLAAAKRIIPVRSETISPHTLPPTSTDDTPRDTKVKATKHHVERIPTLGHENAAFVSAPAVLSSAISSSPSVSNDINFDAFAYSPTVIPRRQLRSATTFAAALPKKEKDNHSKNSSSYFQSSSSSSNCNSSDTKHDENRKTKKRKRNQHENDSPPKVSSMSTTTTTTTNTQKDEIKVKRTSSFEPIWHNRFDPDTNIKIHTLLLGTHPSVESLSQGRLFAFNTNAFWWIAGDCLGFRRDTAISTSSNKPYNFATDLRYGQDKIIPYEEQLEVLTSHGFAVWDIVQSCERKGSLDSNIQNETPNQIREFCQSHPSIKRLVFVNGKQQCSIFNRHFHDWWMSGALKPADTDSSRQVFKKYIGKKNLNLDGATIECLCALSVSPAAAIYSYKEKRDFYDQYCYIPGLEDHRQFRN